MRGGGNLDWIKPLLPGGQRAPGIKGTYRGQFDHWNLEFLKPGFTARRVHKKRVASRQREGYIVATPEFARAYGQGQTAQGAFGTPTDQSENLVLMVAPIEKVAAKQKLLAERTRQQVEGANQQFMDKATGSESRYAKKYPLRFDDGTVSKMEGV